MRFIANDKILFHPARLVPLNLGTPEVIDPVTIELHISNRCNNACFYCGMDKVKDNVELSCMEITDAIDFIASIGAKSVCLTGGGEPTCNTNWPYALSYAHGKGLDVGMITNGINIKKSDHAALCKYATWIRFSLDAADPDIYLSIRKSNSFERVITNINALCSERMRSGSKTIIGVQFVVNTYNYALLSSDIQIVLRLLPNIDYIHIRPIETLVNALPYSKQELQHIFFQLHKLELLNNKKIMISEKWDMFKRFENDTADFFPFTECLAAYYIGVIDAHGDFFLCCHHLKNDNYKFCNIFDIGLNADEFFVRRNEVLQKRGPSKGFSRAQCPVGCRGAGINASLYRMQYADHKNFL